MSAEDYTEWVAPPGFAVQKRHLGARLSAEKLPKSTSVTPAELSTSYSHAGFGAHFVEAAVHRDTGEVRVRRMLGVFNGCAYASNF